MLEIFLEMLVITDADDLCMSDIPGCFYFWGLENKLPAHLYSCRTVVKSSFQARAALFGVRGRHHCPSRVEAKMNDRHETVSD